MHVGTYLHLSGWTSTKWWADWQCCSTCRGNSAPRGGTVGAATHALTCMPLTRACFRRILIYLNVIGWLGLWMGALVALDYVMARRVQTWEWDLRSTCTRLRPASAGWGRQGGSRGGRGGGGGGGGGHPVDGDTHGPWHIPYFIGLSYLVPGDPRSRVQEGGRNTGLRLQLYL